METNERNRSASKRVEIKTRRARKLGISTLGNRKNNLKSPVSEPSNSRALLSIYIVLLSVVLFIVAVLAIAQSDSPGAQAGGAQSVTGDDSFASQAPILPPLNQRPNVRVNLREWTTKLSDEIRTVSNKTNCLHKIEKFYEAKGEYETLDVIKLRDQIIGQINILLAQHRDAVSAIVNDAERLAMTHTFVKNLRVNYTDVHRLRNELDPNNTLPLDSSLGLWLSSQISIDQAYGTNQGGGSLGQYGGSSQVPQFTSINGGTPVPGPPEWQTPIKSIMMQVNKNFGDIPVNTSMSAIHLPLPIYAGLPEIMNGIAWTERLDTVFKRNLATYAHVHHQYYGDHLGFLRTFPAHKWRIARTEPDLFDARTRPWYVAGASSPKDVVILVDASGSMTGLRREIAKGVVFEILDTLTNLDYFAVMRFSDTLTPIGLPKCNLRTPRLVPELDEQCRPGASMGAGELRECQRWRLQQEQRALYLRDHPGANNQQAAEQLGQQQAAAAANWSYLSDDAYKKSIYNVSQNIRDAYLLPATSRNIRYLKSNFSMPTAGIANFTHALMGAFELLAAYNRTGEQSSQCNQAIMLITDGAIKSHEEIFHRYNYPNAPVRLFTYMIGREVGDITHTKAMACNNRGYYTHVINLGEVREQVQKYLAVMARPLILSKHHPTTWTGAYGDETHQVLTDWVLEAKRRERARIMLNEERERMSEANSSDVINIELTNLAEYDELPLVDEELKNRIICEDAAGDDPQALEQSLEEELDPLGYNELACHWASRRADLLTSVVRPVFDQRNTSLYFERILHKNIWTEKETQVRNAQLLGVAAVDLRIADIMRAAPSHLFGPNGYAALVSQSGFMLHHPDLRALLEDPFDKQSKILKPYFNAVDLSHIELVHAKNETKRLEEEARLLELRKSLLRRLQTNAGVTLTVKRAVDCRRRPHVRAQTFYHGPIQETPFSLLIALPVGYGASRLRAKLPLDHQAPAYFKPSTHDLWTVHPEYRYCDGAGLSRNSSVSTVLEVMAAVERGAGDSIDFDDLAQLEQAPAQRNPPARGHQQQQQQQQQQPSANKIVCDKDLFPSLLFDAAATFERPDAICGQSSNFGANCDQGRSPFASFYPSGPEPSADPLCGANSADEMRLKLANIYGLEMSFVATQSGLTRVRVFDLTPRIKKLAELFIKRHNKAVDEPWYARTVDWNARHNDEATIITAPYNAYIRLIAKLRQRITQRHPALNDTRANCDPSIDAQAEQPEAEQPAGSESAASEQPSSAEPPLLPTAAALLAAADAAESAASSAPVAETSDEAATEPTLTPVANINYNDYSSFDFLDLLTNSSVHISATQTLMAKKGSRQRAPLAVAGLLYDYATFARRFLNATSLNIELLAEPEQQSANSAAPFKVDICPGGECPTRCGLRNDTVDCLLVDNNGFIVVSEELPHVGRSLLDYDERLMAALVERHLFHQVTLTDYQAICTRANEPESGRGAGASSGSAAAAASAQTSAAVLGKSNLLSWELTGALLANLASAFKYLWTVAAAALASQAAWSDLSAAGFLGPEMQWARSAVFGPVEAQSAVANQSLLALLPNKTYLRPCEKSVSLYETRPPSANLQAAGAQGGGVAANERPEFYVTKCACSAWYVYEWVPRTNLLMLIVNTTSACRRCSAEPAAPPNLVPVAPVETAGAAQAGGVSASTAAFWLAANKSAEEQVCAMLERDAQLYARKAAPETCYAHHQEEAHIHICGAALALEAPRFLLLLLLAALLSLHLLIAGWPTASCAPPGVVR